MPVRTAYAGAAVAGEVLTAANVNKLPGGWIGYAEVTANQAGLGSSLADLTGLSVAVTVGTSRRLRISCHVRFNAAGTGAVDVSINEGATVLGDAVTAYPSTSFQQSVDTSVIITPSAGAHTYKIQAAVPAAGGTLIAAATRPSFIVVEDIGPAT